MKTTASIPIPYPAQSMSSYPWLMLISRSLLFLLFQLLIALVLTLTGTASSWSESARWWTFIAFLDAIRFSRATWKTDLIWFFGSSFLTLPIAALPMNFLGSAIFGDPLIPSLMLFRSLPAWAFVLSFLFPLTIAFAELPTYFGYVMPRLESQLRNGWLAWLIASLALAAQHMFLPLIFDGGFILWRLLMYLPFALFTGLLIKLRPTLLPYTMIGHALADISAVLVYLTI
jgi:hypothetical protein